MFGPAVNALALLRLWFALLTAWIAVVVRVALATARSVLALVGAAALLIAWHWDVLDPQTSVSANDAVAGLHALVPVVLASLAILCGAMHVVRFLAVGSFPKHQRMGSDGGWRLPLFDLWTTARHEAAHALVAEVLGVPHCGARVVRASGSAVDDRASAGWVDIGPAPRMTTAGDLYSLAVRKIAVAAAGALGARRGRLLDEALLDSDAQADWVGAGQLAWLAGPYCLQDALLTAVAEAVLSDLGTGSWQAAIDHAAEDLVLAHGGVVPPERFGDLARRFQLSMPSTAGHFREGLPSSR